VEVANAVTAILFAVAATFSIVIAAAFASAWRELHDRFFLLFATAFAVLALHWFLLAVSDTSEHRPYHYSIRLFAFVLMIAAIVVKNRAD
jgi:hypothetical protein